MNESTGITAGRGPLGVDVVLRTAAGDAGPSGAPSPAPAPALSVAELIERRRDGDRVGGGKLGLAIEGGGMRGIVSGAMVLALSELGLMESFDAFYGTSSGAMNLAYHWGGAGWEGLAIYYDHLTDGFVHRTPWSSPVVDMDYGFDEVMGRTVPIGWERIRDFDRPVFTVLTNVDRVRSEVVDMRTFGADALDWAKAASWMPMVAGGPPVLGGSRYLDGVVLCPDPVYAAVADGCTHVLVCNSSPRGVWPAAPRSRRMVRPLLNRLQDGLGEAYVRSRSRWDADRRAARFDGDTVLDGARVLRLAAERSRHDVRQLTMRRDVLLDGARAGYRAVAERFGSAGRPYFILRA